MLVGLTSFSMSRSVNLTRIEEKITQLKMIRGNAAELSFNMCALGNKLKEFMIKELDFALHLGIAILIQLLKQLQGQKAKE